MKTIWWLLRQQDKRFVETKWWHYILPVIYIVYVGLDNLQLRCSQRNIMGIGSLYGGKIVD